MGDEPAAPLDAAGQVHLKPGAAAAEPAIGVAGREQQAQARRECDPAAGAVQRLVAVVEARVPDPGVFADRLHGKGQAQLVPLRRRRPFLGERVRPVALSEAREAADVLDDARLLVVGLLEQEAVVGDPRRRRGGRRLRRGQGGSQEEIKDEPSRWAACHAG